MANRTLHVRPRLGRKVPDLAIGDFLPEAGRYVPCNTYWKRRLIAGDVEPVPAPKPTRTKRPSRSS